MRLYKDFNDKLLAIKLVYPIFSKELLEKQAEICGSYSFFEKDFPMPKFNHRRFLEDLDVKEIQQVQCRHCGKVFEKSQNKNIGTALFKHEQKCEIICSFTKKYSWTKETLEKELNVLGTVQDFIKKYPEINRLAYEFIKQFNIDTSIAKVVKLTRQRARLTSIKNCGVDHNFNRNHPSRIAWQEKMLEEEGITTVFQRESVKDKIYDTFLKKYDSEDFSLAKSKDDLNKRGRCVVSNLNKWLFEVLKENGIKFESEFKLNAKGFENRRYFAYDVLLENTKKLIEVNGDYWHCNPLKYKENDLLLKGTNGECTAKEVWIKNKKKIDFAESKEYTVLVIWENEIKVSEDEVIRRIIEYAKC